MCSRQLGSLPLCCVRCQEHQLPPSSGLLTASRWTMRAFWECAFWCLLTTPSSFKTPRPRCVCLTSHNLPLHKLTQGTTTHAHSHSPSPPSQDEGRYLVTAENSSGTCQAQIKVTVIKASPPESESCDSHMICVCDQVIIM